MSVLSLRLGEPLDKDIWFTADLTAHTSKHTHGLNNGLILQHRNSNNIYICMRLTDVLSVFRTKQLQSEAGDLRERIKHLNDMVFCQQRKVKGMIEEVRGVGLSVCVISSTLCFDNRCGWKPQQCTQGRFNFRIRNSGITLLCLRQESLSLLFRAQVSNTRAAGQFWPSTEFYVAHLTLTCIWLF